MLKKMMPPRHPDPVVQRFLMELYDNMNSVVASLHTTGFGQSRDTEGAQGDLRVRKVGKNQYVLEMKHEDGWVESAEGTFKQITGPGHFSGLETVNSSPGTYTNATVTVDEKGRSTVVASGAATPTNAFSETPAGAVDGVNLVYTLLHTPISGSLRVRKDGLCMRLITDYSVSGTTITFVSGNAPTQWLEADYTY